MEKTIEQLLKEVKEIAIKKYEDDFTIYSFSTNYKGCYGVVAPSDIYNFISWLPPHKNLRDLLECMIKYPDRYCYNDESAFFADEKEKHEMFNLKLEIQCNEYL